MTDLIEDRGRGPELAGTRITVYTLLQSFLDPTMTEAEISRIYDITARQVAAARAYVLGNPDTVLAEHLKIEQNLAAGNPPEVRVQAGRALRTLQEFKRWLAEREAQERQYEKDHTRSGHFPTFREWLAAQDGREHGRKPMPGLLADVNVQGHLPYLQRLLEQLELMELLAELGLTLATFSDLGLDRRVDDRTLWTYCQANGWVLFTDNRNNEDKSSLQATLDGAWQPGHLPVITLANKRRFENSEHYALLVAEETADVLVRAFHDAVRDQPRIFVPLRQPV